MRKSILVFISLWISLSAVSNRAHAWGELGHRIIAEYGSGLADQKDFENCHITAAQIVSHTNDPDKTWKQQRREHPKEPTAHYFHVDRQPSDWRSRKDAADPTQGYLVYRITSWIDEAKKMRQSKKWDDLSEHLYGLSHYMGDLTQPLHLHHDHDGEEAGLPDLHSQFETKMLNRYEDDAREGVQSRLKGEKIPALWSQVDLKTLVFDTAQQTYSKYTRLVNGAKPALQMPKQSKKKKASKKPPQPRFVKKALWEGTGALAEDQLALGARLWAHVLNSICQ